MQVQRSDEVVHASNALLFTDGLEQGERFFVRL
jgi:hypothetical protein